MHRFIDTIKLTNGNYTLIDYHNNRIKYTINHFYGFYPEINLEAFLPKPEKYKVGTYKCRLTYSNHIESVEITPYSKREIKKLKIIDLDTSDFSAKYKAFDYKFKYEDRTAINFFLTGIDDVSDILIVKDGLITDTSFSNVILFDGKKWVTPDAYLLNGIKRRYLLENKEITEEKISVDDLNRFEKISLINAMLEPEDIVIDICNVMF